MTIEGETHALAPPFVVLATQNPIEYEGTYPLPEAQLDRFLLRIGVGYPSREHEWEMLDRRIDRAADEVDLEQVVDRATLVEMQRAVEQVHVEESLGYYIVDLAVATRSAPGVQVGASPRGSLALLKLARCRAALSGRDFTTPDDVKAVAVPALAHRLTLRPELWVERRRSDDIVRELLERVPTPAVQQPEQSAPVARVTRSATGKLHVYVVLAGLGLLGGLTLGRPELVAIAAPFAFFAALGARLREAALAEGAAPRSRASASSRVARSTSSSSCPPTGRCRAWRSSSTCPRRSSRKRRTRSSSASRAGSAASSRSRSGASTGARTRWARSSGARGTPTGCSSTRAGRASCTR